VRGIDRVDKRVLIRPGFMDTRTCAVYNLARGILLNSKLTVADCASQPLRILSLMVGGLGLDSESGLWLNPLHTVPGVPRVFPFDLLYLDKDHRVLETAEISPGIEFPRYREEVASALVLPSKILHTTGTQPGDELIVCPADQLEALLAVARTAAAENLPGDHKKALGKTVAAASHAENSRTVAAAQSVPARIPSAAASLERSILHALSNELSSSESLRGATEEQVQSLPVVTATDPAPSETINLIPEQVSEELRDPRPTAAASRPENVENLFSNWVGSSPKAPSDVDRDGSRRSDVFAIEPPLPAATAQTQARQQTHSGNNAKKADSTMKEESDSLMNKREKQQSSFDSPRQTAQEQAKPRGILSASDAKPTQQKAPGNRVAREIPPRISNSRPMSSTTTFATRSFPLWQVSPPTAIPPRAGAKPALVATQSNSKPETVAPRIGETKASAIVNTPENAPEKLTLQSARPSESLQRPAKTPGAEAARQCPPPPQKPIAAHSTAPTQDQPRRMWPKVPAASSPEVVQEHKTGIAQPSPAEIESRPAVPNAAAAMPKVARPEIETKGSTLPSSVGQQDSEPASERAMNVLLPRFLKLDQQGKLKTPGVDTIPKNDSPPPTLRSKFKRWLHPASHQSDRRETQRRYVPGMIAHYFSGGAPKPHEIADISMSGFYLLTEDRWMSGTMIQMTLQKPCTKGERKQSITVLARIVRRGSDGVGAEFVTPDSVDSSSHDIQPSQATDKFALARFL